MNAVYFTEDQLAWLAQAWSNTPVEIKDQLDANCKFENQLLDVGAYDQLEEENELDYYWFDSETGEWTRD